jgi:hypothetical protein
VFGWRTVARKHQQLKYSIQVCVVEPCCEVCGEWLEGRGAVEGACCALGGQEVKVI